MRADAGRLRGNLVARSVSCCLPLSGTALMRHIAYPSVPVSTPLLAITCNVTFKKGLDPSLDDLFLPEEPPATPRKRSSAPPIPLKRPITPPPSEYAKANSGPSSPSKPLPRPDKLVGAKERNRRVEEEEYQFMEEIDLLEGLDLGRSFSFGLDVGSAAL